MAADTAVGAEPGTGSGTGDGVMLTIDWKSSDNKGWIDYIPMGWFLKTGSHGVREHRIIGSKGEAYPAFCTLVVRELEATMDYGGENKKENEKNNVDTGVMRFVFSDRSRKEVSQILWKEVGASDFVDGGTVFGMQEDDIALIEGGSKLVQHMRAERRPELVKHKKDAMLDEKGYLVCELCDADYRLIYGECAPACYEVHHDGIALAKRGVGLADLKGLKVLCANCHRAIHRTNPMITVDAFRKRLGKI